MLDDENNIRKKKGRSKGLADDSVVQGIGVDQKPVDAALDQNDDDSGHANMGIKALLKNKSIHYGRLPMLEVVFDRLLRLMSASMRNFTSENIDISIEDMRSLRFGDYLDAMPFPAMLGVFKAEEWENQGLITIDSGMIYSLFDVLLGGSRGNSLPMEGRPYTSIEQGIIQRLIKLTLSDLEQAFFPISDVQFNFERLEINPRFAMITGANSAAIVLTIRFSMEDRGGNLEVLLPYATIEPIRELLLQNFMGEKFGRDSIWEKHLAEQLWDTDFTLELKLPDLTSNLREVMEWKEGTVLEFNCNANDHITLSCQNHPLIRGRLGQKNGFVAVCVEQSTLDLRGE